MVSDPDKPEKGIHNNFNSDLKIKPYSKVGLVSCSLPLDLNNININDVNNDKLRLKTTNGGAWRPVALINGFYNNASFAKELTRACNATLDFVANSRSDGGFQHDFSVATTGILDWQIRRAKDETIVIPDANKKGNATYDGTTLDRGAGANSDSNYVYTDAKFINSCGCIRGSLLSDQPFIFGLVETVQNLTLPHTDFKYAILKIGANYGYVVNGAMFNVGNPIPCLVGDVLSIELNLGRIYLKVYRAGAAVPVTVLYQAVYDQTQAYRFACTLINAASSMNGLKWTPDPRITTSWEGVVLDGGLPVGTLHDYNNFNEVTQFGATPDPATGGAGNRIFKYEFLGNALKDIMGFSAQDDQTNAISHVFNGNVQLIDSTTPDSVMIQLENLKIRSFDGVIGGERSILAVIPSFNITAEKLTYTLNPPLMLDLENVYELTTRDIRLRLFGNSDGEEIKLANRVAQVTIVIS